MHHLTALAASIVVLGLSGLAQEPVELRWRGRPGDVLRYRITMTQTVESAMMPDPARTESAFVFRQEVLEVSPEGVGSLEVEYEALRMETEGPVSMSYDSTRKGEEAGENDARMASMLEPLLGAKFRMKVDESNHILEIAGLAEVLDRLETPAMADALKGMFNEDNLRRMFEVNTFPEQALQPGDEWERAMEIEVPFLGTMELGLQNELQGIERRGEDDCAAIRVTGEARLDGTAETPMPVEVSIDDSSIAGTMIFALERGTLIESSLRMSMDMTMSPAGGTAEGMEMRMSTTSEQHFLRIGEDDAYFE